MIASQIARIIAHFVLFFDYADESAVDPDVAVHMMEGLSYELERLDKEFLRELVDAFATIASEYVDDAADAVRRIPYDFQLEELLAEDDPVRLAELEAIRDAEPPMNLDNPPTWPMKPAS